MLGLIAAGKSNNGISTVLGITTGTVERHVGNLYSKIGVHSRSEATAYAFRHQLIDPPRA